jgi:dihydroflavonol-4-reductase
VFHAAAALGHNHESPQEIYDLSLHGTVSVLESVKAAGSVRRVIFTSSAAAVAHPRPEGYVFTEKDWAGDNVEAYKGRWTKDRVSKDGMIAYAMAKAEGERVAKKIAEEDGRFDTVSVNPMHVLGPLLCANHFQPDSWQAALGRMLEGPSKKTVRRMLWNVTDVRDIADMQCLIAESHLCKNGARYIAAAADRSGEFFTPQLQAKLAQLYPHLQVAVEAGIGKPIYDAPRMYCLLAKEVLGLQPHSADSTLRATCDSLLELGLITPQKLSKL